MSKVTAAFIIYFISSWCEAKAINNSKVDSDLAERCAYAKNFDFEKRIDANECCNYNANQYARMEWASGARYLTNFMENMKAWNCSQFYEECNKPTYDFTDYTKMVYQYFCNYEQFQTHCSTDLNGMLDLKQNWTDQVMLLNTSLLSDEDIMNPCVQLIMYENDSLSGKHNFSEIVHITIPACGWVWQGFSAEAIQQRNISPWTLAPLECQVTIIILMTGCCLLGLTIAVANIIVFYYFKFSKRAPNSQSVYKISLALGDFLTGVVVLPTFASSIYRTLFTVQHPGEYATVYGSVFNNDTWQGINATVYVPEKPLQSSFNVDYLRSVGFITTFSLMVSLYTLLAASFDRFLAIRLPLKYTRETAKKIAKRTVFCIWLIAIVFCILPLGFIEGLYYNMLSGFLVLAVGRSVEIFYVAALVIPLLLCWVFTILTYTAAKEHAKTRMTLTQSRQLTFNKNLTLEERLAKTLSIMTAFFTLSILPPALCYIGILFPSVLQYYPKSIEMSSAVAYTTVEFLCGVLFVCNSLWNFFIYNARNKEFRTAFTSSLSRLKPTITEMTKSVRSTVRQVLTPKRTTGQQTIINPV